MEKELHICKFMHRDLNNFCVILSEWKNNHILFKILEFPNFNCNQISSSSEWQGELLMDNLKHSANELGMYYEDFLNECKLAFCVNNNNMPANVFCYYIKNNIFVLQKNERHKCTYIEMNVESVSNLKDQIVLDCVNIIGYQDNEIKESDLKLQSLNVDYQTTLQSYQKLIEEKNNLEKKLFTKFAALLNTKKDKIAELQGALWEKKNTFAKNSRDLNVEPVISTENADLIYSQPTQKLPKRKQFIRDENVGSIKKHSSAVANCSNAEYDSENEIYENNTDL